MRYKTGTIIQSDELSSVERALIDSGYEKHHTATRAGYVSRAFPAYIEPYAGKYGIGYIVHYSSPVCSTYHMVTYYIKNQKEI